MQTIHQNSKQRKKTKNRFSIPCEELRKMYIENQMPMSEIAIFFGCSVQTISNKLHGYCITVRSSRKHTNRTKKKQSEAKSGEKHPFYGKKRPLFAELISLKLKGIKFTLETRQKMSAAKCGMWGGKFIGTSHPRWLPPNKRKNPLYKQIRDLKEMKNWRKKIFDRDNYTCCFCKQRGGILNADHIKQFALILKERQIKTSEDAKACSELWETDNGRTLCEKCHRGTDTFAKKVGKNE